MKKIAPALSAHALLLELRASHNHLGDEGAEGLFSVLCLSRTIEVVTLSSVQLRGGKWARHLAVTETLHTLDLSHNGIDDLALQSLCSILVDCGSIRFLNISYNAFGLLAVSLGGLITNQKGLLGLDISGNILSDDTVESIRLGLEENRTLRHLDVSYCALRIDNVTKLCSVLSENFLVSLRILGNPVPLSIQEDPRAFAIKEAVKWRAFDEGKTMHISTLPLRLHFTDILY
jgi:Ran GTPase-activating protein (RanGAP) involved in mRNA processing and transport